MKTQRLLFPFVMLLFPLLTYSQIKEEDITDGDSSKVVISIYPEVLLSQKPQFPGGDVELKKWFAKNAFFTQAMADSGHFGKVYCGVIIDSIGNIRDPKIYENPKNPANPYLVKETLRLMNILPCFSPGKTKDKTVASQHPFILVFRPDTVGMSASFNRPGSIHIFIYPK